MTSKVAVIGAGKWGMNLVKTFHQMGALAAVVEADPAKRQTILTQFDGVRCLENLTDVFDAGIPAVAIATPAPTHFALVAQALDLGLDVFVEKPFTLSLRDALELTTLAKSRNRILMVGHLLLYQPAVRWLKSFIDEGKLGAIYSIHQERLNLGRVRNSEDVLWSLGVHDVAVLLDLVGAHPTEINVQKQPALQSGIADEVFVHMKFPRGIQSHLHVSWLWPEKSRRTVVVGEKGMLIYDEADQSVRWHKKTVDKTTLENVDLGVETVFQQSGEPLKLELQHFLDRCTDRQPPLSGAESACTVIEVLEKASRSNAVSATSYPTRSLDQSLELI